MKDQLRAVLKDAINEVQPFILASLAQRSDVSMAWRKNESGNWEGYESKKPDISRAFFTISRRFEEIGEEFNTLFFEAYPQFRGPAIFVNMNMSACDPNRNQLFRGISQYLWEKYGEINDERILDRAVDEVLLFAESPNLTLCFQALLFNFKSEVQSISLPEDICIRQLTEKEMHLFNSAHVDYAAPSMDFPHEFILEGELQEPIHFKSFKELPKGQEYEEIVQERLNRAILYLHSFKEGTVGYNYIRFFPKYFCPVGHYRIGAARYQIPYGKYEIRNGEITSLQEYARQVISVTDRSMLLSLRRLADAHRRTRSEDRILDAVVGMESLLLAGLNPEDRKGELKFRFSLNYSTLFSSQEERHIAFRVAKDLYDLRSTIAHGGDCEKPTFRIGSEKLILPDAAQRATECLRYIIRYFLQSNNRTAYRSPEFWEKGYFGVR